MSMRYAGMFTTTRVSVGIAFGPGSICGPGSALAVATALLACGDGAVGSAGADDEVEFRFGSITQPVRNKDKTRISRVRFISLTPSTSLEQRAFLVFYRCNSGFRLSSARL